MILRNDESAGSRENSSSSRRKPGATPIWAPAFAGETGYSSCGGQRRAFRGGEVIQEKVGGLALLVEGTFYDRDNPERKEPVHSTLGVISYAPGPSTYRFLTWLANGLHLSWLLNGILGLPLVGGPSLSFSYIGTFLVFVYIWIPYMILPIQAALERVPANYIEASADLGAKPRQTFWTVIFPLALPGIIAGSIFTFSLTLGDYIVPTIVGNSRLMIGQAVYTLQGTAGNIPLAAAFTVVPMVIMGIYLWVAKRMGEFDVL